MRYDWLVNAIGPFEMSEYLGLTLVYAALALTRSSAGTRRRVAYPVAN